MSTKAEKILTSVKVQSDLFEEFKINKIQILVTKTCRSNDSFV